MHIVLDDVQFRRRNFQNRAQYSSPDGPKLLTVPVLSKGHQQSSLKIQDIELAPQNLYKQFLTLKHRYGKTPGWPLIQEELEQLYSTSFNKLSDLNLALLQFALRIFQIETPVLLSSALNSEGKKNEKLIQLCQHTNATHYLSGNGARKYMDDLLFARYGIQVRYQNYQHPQYSQGHSGEFQSGCFALDYFFHHPDKARALFKIEPNKVQEESYALA